MEQLKGRIDNQILGVRGLILLLDSHLSAEQEFIHGLSGSILAAHLNNPGLKDKTA